MMATMKDNGQNGRSLPEGWEWMTIGDVADTTSGGTPSRKYPQYFEGTIPWVKSGELGDGLVSFVEETITETAIKNSSAKLFPAGTVLVALYGATVGKVGILNMDAATNQAVCALFPKNNLFTAKYMFYWLMSQRRDLINKSMGGAQPNISQGIVRSHPFPLAPLPEQERIVSRIEELFSDLEAGGAGLERVRAGLRRYKASVLKAACDGKLMNGKSGIGNHELPEGWQWSTVQGLNPPNRKCAYGVLQPGIDKEDGVLFVRVGDIGDGRIDVQNLKRIDPKIAAKYPRTKLQGGEVLITLVGAIGRTAVVPESLAGANTARAVGVIPVKDGVHAPWVEIWFRNTEKVIEMTSKAHEVARKTLNLEDVRAAKVALPPLDEQRRIVAEVERRLSVVGEVESAVEVGLVRAARLRQAVLRSAFEGRL